MTVDKDNSIIPKKIKGTGFFTPIDIPPPNTKGSDEIEKPYEDRTETNIELRKMAHRALDRYLDSGGSYEFTILSDRDFERIHTAEQLILEKRQGWFSQSDDKDGIPI